MEKKREKREPNLRSILHGKWSAHMATDECIHCIVKSSIFHLTTNLNWST